MLNELNSRNKGKIVTKYHLANEHPQSKCYKEIILSLFSVLANTMFVKLRFHSLCCPPPLPRHDGSAYIYTYQNISVPLKVWVNNRLQLSARQACLAKLALHSVDGRTLPNTRGDAHPPPPPPHRPPSPPRPPPGLPCELCNNNTSESAERAEQLRFLLCN